MLSTPGLSPSCAVPCWLGFVTKTWANRQPWRDSGGGLAPRFDPRGAVRRLSALARVGGHHVRSARRRMASEGVLCTFLGAFLSTVASSSRPHDVRLCWPPEREPSDVPCWRRRRGRVRACVLRTCGTAETNRPVLLCVYVRAARPRRPCLPVPVCVRAARPTHTGRRGTGRVRHGDRGVVVCACVRTDRHRTARGCWMVSRPPTESLHHYPLLML